MQTGGEAGIRSRQVSAKHRFAIFCSVASRHLDPRDCGYPEDTPAVEPYGFSSLAGRYSMRKHGVRGSIMYWRRGRDSNPGYRLTRHNGFRDRRIQPLCHLSAKSRNYATRRSWICSGIGKASEGSSGARDSSAARPSSLWAVRASAEGIRLCVRRSRSVNSLRGPHRGRVIDKSGGEAGIRTLDTLLAHTRFPIVLLRPARTPLRVQRLQSATQKYKPKPRNSSTGS